MSTMIGGPEPDTTDARLVMASSRRANAIQARNRSLLQIEIDERNAIAAEARVAECDAEVTALLDLKLVERLAAQMVDAGS